MRLGIVRGISYGMFGPPDSFIPETTELGARLARVYIYWNQVEPAPGRYDWTVVDAVLDQLDPAGELWVTVCSSSAWATRKATGFLPSSPALDLPRYERFVVALVTRCRGRVRYWQCNNEPSNTGLLWAGTAAEYVEQLVAFHRGVHAADPAARVVLGGCGYDVLSDPDGGPGWQFFDHVVEHGRGAFDLFSVHLYGNPAAIPGHVESVRALMRRHGYQRPVVAGEYNGPTLFEFPEALAAFGEATTAAFTAPPPADPGPDDTPERRTMQALYDRFDELPPQLQMFMDGCPDDLAARRQRISCRQLVTRNILALSVGIGTTVCWSLAPEIPGYTDPLNMMGFLFGTLALLDYEGARLTRCHPPADTFALVSDLLHGAERVCRLAIPGPREIHAFDVVRPGGGPLQVLWAGGDTFTGEDDPAVLLDHPWPYDTAHAIDVFGDAVPLGINRLAGTVRVPLTITPLFMSVHAHQASRSAR